jgi:hypothetical protein
MLQDKTIQGNFIILFIYFLTKNGFNYICKTKFLLFCKKIIE